MVDKACEQLFDEISIKVLLEKDGGMANKSYSPLTEEERATFNNLISSQAVASSGSHQTEVVLQPLPLVGAPAVPVPAEASATELEDALPQVLPPVTAATAYPRPELVVQVMSDVVAPVPPTAPSSLSSGIAQPSVAEAGLLPLDLPVGCGARGKDPLLAPTSQASGGTEP